MQTRRWIKNAAAGCVTALVAGVLAVGGGSVPQAGAAAPPAPLVALTASSTLLRFDAATPGAVSTPVAITGLLPGESVVGIDVRPATGELFGVGVTGSSGRVLRIDPGTGVATQIGATPFSVALTPGATYVVDFNPVPDRIRFTRSGVGGENLRLNPDTGALAFTDTPISGGSVIGAAYDRSVRGATVTTLYAINDVDDSLATVGGLNGAPTPNGGVVTPLGPLGVVIDPSSTIGFDIAPSAAPLGNAYAALRVGGTYQIYTVNLSTGAASAQGTIVGVPSITDIAVLAVVPPSPLVALTGANTLLRFNAATPGTVAAPIGITGLQAGETIVGIDFRPATGELFGVGVTGTTGRIYRIDVTTGVATVVGAAPFSTTLPAGATYSVDFNPTVDRIRFTQAGAGGVNLRLNPNNGTLAATDTPISGGSIIGAAYDRNVATATVTTLYAINDDNDSLATIGGLNSTPSPNTGVVTNVGPLNVVIDPATTIGFDIAPSAAQFGVAYAALRVAGTYRIYTVDLMTGAATAGGAIATGAATILDLAVPAQFAEGGSQFTPLTPTRVLDTRNGTGAPASKPGQGAIVEVQVTGGAVPANATAVVLNIVGTEATADGFLTAFPTCEDRPLAANQNLVTGQTRGNLATVKVGTGGKVSIYTQSGTHLVADVFGYYAAPTGTAGRFTALSPARLLDTRETTKVGPGGTVDVQAAGNGGVPATGATSVVISLSATEATAAGFITGYAAGTTQPTTANLNVERAGQTIGNLAILPLNATGAFTLFSQSGTHLVVDVFGYFGDATARGGAGGLFVPTSPTRLLNTREAPNSKLGRDSSIDLTIAGIAPVPGTGVASAVVNLTAVEVTAPGFVTMYPTGIPRPLVSSVYGDTPGQIIPSLAYATLGAGGKATIYSNMGTHVVVDLAGYYTS